MERNIASVLGSDRRFWLLPVYAGGPLGDGVHWPVHKLRWYVAEDDDELLDDDAERYGEQRRGASDQAKLLEEGGALMQYSSCEDEE